jgi:Domain of unknown function (DUF4123)
VLLPLPLEAQALRAKVNGLLHHRAERPMLSFVLSPLDAPALIAQWQGTLTCQTDDGQRFLLRFADTRVQPALAVHLAYGAWSWLSAHVHAWLSLARNGQPAWLSLPPDRQARQAELATRPAAQQQRLDDQALDALLADSLPDAVLDALAERLPEVLSAQGHAAGAPGRPRSEVHAWVARACQVAAQEGVDAFDSQVMLAAAVLLSDGALLADPALTGLLREHGRDAGALNEALLGRLP